MHVSPAKAETPRNPARTREVLSAKHVESLTIKFEDHQCAKAQLKKSCLSKIRHLQLGSTNVEWFGK